MNSAGKITVLLAHGSRDENWCARFHALAGDVRRRLDAPVELAFMELASPTLAQVVARLHAGGVRQVQVLPVFMAAGAHVRKDIPAQAEACRAVHRDLTLTVLPPVGDDPRFFDLLAGLIQEQVGDRT